MSFRNDGVLAAGLLTGGALVFLATVANAEPREVLSVEQAVKMAIERRPIEEVQSARLREVDAEREAAKAWPNPTFSFDREQQWEPGGSVAEDFFILEQSIPIWGVRRLRAEAAERRREATKASNRARRLDRRIAVERAFYASMRERQTLSLARDLREQIGQSVEIMEERRRADEASAYAVERMRESLLEAEAEVDAARASLVEARGELAALVDRSATPTDAWSVTGELLPQKLPDLESLTARLDERADLAKLRALARAESKAEKAIGRSLVPTPALRGGYKRIDDPAGGSLHGFVVGVSIELPIFNQAGGERRSASARRAGLKARERLRRNEAERRLRAAHRVAEIRLETARRYREEAVKRAEELLESARERQEAGEGSVFELVDAHRTVFETKARAAERAWKAREAVIKVEEQAGGFP